MKKIIIFSILLTLLCGFTAFSAPVTKSISNNFDGGSIESGGWAVMQYVDFQDGKLLLSITPEGKIDWGALRSTNYYSGGFTYELDIDVQNTSEGELNVCFMGLRLPASGAIWNQGLWIGVSERDYLIVKANSTTNEYVKLDIPINFENERRIRIEDNSVSQVKVYSYLDNGSEVLLTTIKTEYGKVTVYDRFGEEAGSFATSLHWGGYLGIMSHYLISTIDNITVTPTYDLNDLQGLVKTITAQFPATVGGTAVNKIFKDIDHVDWAWEGIAALNARGVVAGTSATTYEPDGVLTREQFIKMTVGAFDLMDTSAVTSFGDVVPGEWYYSYVASAEKAGLLEGIYSGNLGVGQPISREDMATIAARALDKKGLALVDKKEAITFDDDGAIAPYAKEPVYRMYRAGIINGMTETTFEPQSSCTRAMAAKVLCGLLEYYPVENFRDTMPDTWVGADELGRELLTAKDTRDYRTDKLVGVFYYIWHDRNDDKIYNSAQEFAKPREERSWVKNQSYYAQEPYFGYYRTSDEYVIRKNMQMLADSGVDFIFFDNTNNSSFCQQQINIMKVLREMQNEGKKVPKVCSATNSLTQNTVSQLYMNIYSKDLYRDTWFFYEGKPLLLTDPGNMPRGTEDFFTVRQCWAYGWGTWWEDGQHKWPWLAAYPQPYGWSEHPTVPEQLIIATAQHASTNIGKSFSGGSQPEELRTNEGLYFAEQISRLDSVDPKVLMITQWNEKTAGAYVNSATSNYTLGNEKDPDGWYFVDAMAEEWNRDIEPVRGSYGDNYYYQMANAVRKFRGVRPYPSTEKSHTITIGKDFGAWAEVEEVYFDDVYDIPHRDSDGSVQGLRYTDTSGRNDFVESKAARDDENLYFYVKTRDNITEAKDADKMHTVLLLNTDGSYKTGWYGYDYIIGRARKDGFLSVEKNLNGRFDWKVVSRAPYVTLGNEKHLSVSKADLELEKDAFTVDFKWADNQPEALQIMDFIDKGDAAPNGRFNYRFEAKK